MSKALTVCILELFHGQIKVNKYLLEKVFKHMLNLYLFKKKESFCHCSNATCSYFHFIAFKIIQTIIQID